MQINAKNKAEKDPPVEKTEHREMLHNILIFFTFCDNEDVTR